MSFGTSRTTVGRALPGCLIALGAALGLGSGCSSPKRDFGACTSDCPAAGTAGMAAGSADAGGGGAPAGRGGHGAGGNQPSDAGAAGVLSSDAGASGADGGDGGMSAGGASGGSGGTGAGAAAGSGGRSGASQGGAAGAAAGAGGSGPACGSLGNACCAGNSCLGGATCQGGSCSCAGGRTACGGSCVDLLSDAKNCSACSHSCLSAACTLGACDPIVLEQTQGRLFTVAVDSQYVYWGGDGARIAKKNLDGSGLFKELVSPTLAEYSYDWALAGTTLFWGNDWHDLGVRGCTLPDCSSGPATFIAGASNLHAMTYDPKSKTLFWDQSDGIWHKVLPTGAATLFVPSSSYIADMTTDGTFLYWVAFDVTAKSSIIYKTPVGSNSPTTLVSNRPEVDKLAVYANALYFVELPSSTSTSSQVRSVPLPNGVGTGAPTLLGSAGGVSLGIAADTDGVYWTARVAGGGDSVATCALGSCAGGPKIIASSNLPWGITTDATAVYWVTEGGQVMKVAK